MSFLPIISNMKFNIKIIAIVCISLFSQLCFSQNITNVDANQEGKAIAITYDLGEKSNISLYISYNNGKDKTLIPIKYTSGDVGSKIIPGKSKKILWKVLDQYPNKNFEGENLSFIVKGKIAMKPFVVINGGYSIDSQYMLGVTAGQLGQVGWYVKGMLTPTMPRNTEFSCNAEGYVGDIMPAYSGKYYAFKCYGVAGMNIRLGIPLYLKTGVGYGERRLYWETYDTNWVQNTPGSYSGLVIDAGLMASFKKVIISAGLTVMQSNIDLNIGIGCSF